MAIEPCSSPYCRDDDIETVREIPAPPNRSQLGTAAWRVYYSAAARQTTESSPEFAQWLNAALRLYPCQVCRPGILRALQSKPVPLVGDEWDSSGWLLFVQELNNQINRDMGKPQAVLSVAELREKWR